MVFAQFVRNLMTVIFCCIYIVWGRKKKEDIIMQAGESLLIEKGWNAAGKHPRITQRVHRSRIILLANKPVRRQYIIQTK